MSEALTNASILRVSFHIIKTVVATQLLEKFPNKKYDTNQFGSSTILARVEIDGRLGPW
jgi:hypothetical protein